MLPTHIQSKYKDAFITKCSKLVDNMRPLKVYEYLFRDNESNLSVINKIYSEEMYIIITYLINSLKASAIKYNMSLNKFIAYLAGKKKIV